MKFAPCPHCGTNRIVVATGHGQYRFRRHGSTDENNRRITCPGSLQHLPAGTNSIKEA